MTHLRHDDALGTPRKACALVAPALTLLFTGACSNHIVVSDSGGSTSGVTTTTSGGTSTTSGVTTTTSGGTTTSLPGTGGGQPGSCKGTIDLTIDGTTQHLGSSCASGQASVEAWSTHPAAYVDSVGYFIVAGCADLSDFADSLVLVFTDPGGPVLGDNAVQYEYVDASWLSWWNAAPSYLTLSAIGPVGGAVDGTFDVQLAGGTDMGPESLHATGSFHVCHLDTPPP